MVISRTLDLSSTSGSLYGMVTGLTVRSVNRRMLLIRICAAEARASLGRIEPLVQTSMVSLSKSVT